MAGAPPPSSISLHGGGGGESTTTKVAISYAGMIVIDADGRIGCGATTNGANHKIPG